MGLRWRWRLVLCFTLLGLAGCASGPAEVRLPLRQAWVDGRQVAYVTTDISDATMARMEGVNHVPRLAQALGGPGRPAVTERVYKFVNGEQITVFQSAPRPAGGANADPNYSPLWRMVLVRWLRPAALRELRSEEEVLAAEERGDVSLEVTDIVVNCPVVRSAEGQALRGVR
ncbi:MAG: hypothetical protein ACK4F4_16350 [Hylemonella sp.]|uniref:DUF7482 domain-containing protein n=1 Tax=Hylemonella sp. TaxID=2066020 RepID=UPI00391A8050